MTLADGAFTLALDSSESSPDLSALWTTIRTGQQVYFQFDVQETAGEDYKAFLQGPVDFAAPGFEGDSGSSPNLTATVNLGGAAIAATLQTFVVAASSVTTAMLASPTGSDTNVVTGTAGTAGDLAEWNADGDLVDGATPPSGAIVGTTDTQTLTNKTIDANSNTLLNLPSGGVQNPMTVDLDVGGQDIVSTSNGHINLVPDGTGRVQVNGYDAIYIPTVPSDAGSTVGIGENAAGSITTGVRNTAVGKNALDAMGPGFNNTAIGADALTALTSTYNSNVAVGWSAGNSYNGGNQSVFIGAVAGSGQTSGNNNIAVGFSTALPSSTGSNQLNIGNWIYGSGGDIGIGTTSPQNPLDVSGDAVVGSSYAGVETAPTDGLLVEGDVGIGTTSPDAAALLDVTSTTKGFLPPRMTTTQRDAISTPPAGLVIYNTTTNVLDFYNGSSWGAV